jgi:hypothetical protein
MGSEMSDTEAGDSALLKLLCYAGARIRQDLNDAVVAELVVQQLEDDVHSTKAPGLGKLPERDQMPSVIFPGELRQDGEPAIRLLISDTAIDTPLGDELFELREGDCVLPHPLHHAAAEKPEAVDPDRSTMFNGALPIPGYRAVGCVLIHAAASAASGLHHVVETPAPSAGLQACGRPLAVLAPPSARRGGTPARHHLALGCTAPAIDQNKLIQTYNSPQFVEVRL